MGRVDGGSVGIVSYIGGYWGYFGSKGALKVVGEDGERGKGEKGGIFYYHVVATVHGKPLLTYLILIFKPC